jgi:hypothetical protein
MLRGTEIAATLETCEPSKTFADKIYIEMMTVSTWPFFS